ncbi:MAG: M48 family metallopeptidase [Pseudomonadota bacterium]
MFDALYFDGETAKTHSVRVAIDGSDLHIAGPGIDERWPLKRLRRRSLKRDKDRVVLAAPGTGEARLVIDDEAAVEQLREAIPSILSTRTLGTFTRRAAILGVVTVASAIAVYVSIPRVASPLAGVVPLGVEQSLGARQIDEMTTYARPCLAFTTEAGGYVPPVPEAGTAFEANNRLRATAALTELVNRLAVNAGAPFPLTVTVLDFRFVNAFALPGGQIVLTRGLLEESPSAEGLAGVIAHEMAHVRQRHPVAGAIQQLGVELLFNLFLTGGSGSAITDSGTMLATMSYSRKFEREADDIAVDILEASAVDVAGFVEFFEMLAEEEAINDPTRGTFEYFLRTHPYADERVQAIKAQMTARLNQPALREDQFSALAAACDR